jgi:hypothetical protein
MFERLNGTVEDLGSTLGYSATAALVDWFGGGLLYVPNEASEAHAICKVIGLPAFVRLCKEWGGKEIWVPLGYQREQDRRDRMIAVLLALGLGSKQVGSVAGMSERHVQAVRFRLENMGVMPLILSRAGLEKPPGKPGLKSRLENRVAKLDLERLPAVPAKAGKRKRRPW